MPGAYTARRKTGLVELISPNTAVNWSANMRKSAMGAQLSPNVSARKDTSVLVPSTGRGLIRALSYAILVVMGVSLSSRGW
jgi:hypothetical protein